MVEHMLQMIGIIGAWINNYATRSIRRSNDPGVRADIGKRRFIVGQYAIRVIPTCPPFHFV